MSYPKITLIACVDNNSAIGYQNKLLFHIKEDMQLFRQLTLNKVVVMGRKTFESLPNGALPNRINIVISSNEEFAKQHQELIVHKSWYETCKWMTDNVNKHHSIYVIGGGQLYATAIYDADIIKLTVVDTRVAHADTWFPKIDDTKWRLEKWTKLESSSRNMHDVLFKTYSRR